jgi:predicted dehydrogenase
MRAGKDVVLDKPGVATLDQLAVIKTTQRETGCRWLVVCAERIGTPAMIRAHKLVHDGRIGDVVHTIGLGPHLLNIEHRPKWFFDPARYGGILADIGSHQADQYLAFTGATSAEVVAATTRDHPDHPGVQVFGEMLLRAPDGRTGYARVDYYTPKGLGSWGDVRFMVVGTTGTIEVSSVDNTVTVVDADKVETIDAADEPVTWAETFLRGEMPVTQEHVFAVHDVCLAAQAAAH